MTDLIRKPDRRLLATWLCTLGLGALACGSDPTTMPPAPGVAFLEIVGPASVTLPFGGHSTLAVRYTDQDGVPLPGKVRFTLVGDGGGSQLAASAGATDGDGVVAVDLTAGPAGAHFEIEASAARAESVSWAIGINQDGRLDVTGTYHLASRFDVASGIPGDLGNAVNTIIDMTDSPYDPATWVIDQAVANLGPGFIKDALQFARPALDGLVNDVIVENSPQAVRALLALGDKLGQVTTRFGTDTTLAVRKQGGGLAAVHTLTGYNFQVDGADYHYEATDLGEQPAAVTGVAVTLATADLAIGQHVMPIRYGGLLALALEDVLVPLIDPSATSLEGLLSHLIDCGAIGAAVAQRLGFGSANLYTGACQLGLQQGAALALSRLRGIDEASPVSLILTGTARVVDPDHDLAADQLVSGKWQGMIDYAGSQSPLAAATSTFSGERMTAPPM